VSDAASASSPAAAPSWTLRPDIPLALAEADLEGRLRRANGRFCSLVGRAEADIVGVTLRELLHEDDQLGHQRELDALVGDGIGYLRDERYLRPDGAVVRATNEIERTTDATGRPALLVAAQATAALLERAELGRARAEAEVRRRDEFLNVLSHELRSPLAAILVWARLLRESGDQGADAERGLEVIERSGRVIENALDDLVQVARIVAGKQELACHSWLDLRAVATVAADAMRDEADRKRVSLACVLPADAVTVSGDPALLQQAVARLLANALKFTPSGGAVELALEGSAAEAVVRVSDTGAGMSEGFLEHAFEPFRQDAHPSRAHRGLGVGLCIVRHLITQHGGQVSATSQGPGKGSVLTIRLPVAAAAADGAATGAPPEPA
jgi:PAS domain S-box-containing protein